LHSAGVGELQARTNIMMFTRRRETAWRGREPPGALIRRRA
jgi:hypothetical protein